MTSLSVNTVLFFFFNDTATTEIYTLSLHDALPIYNFPPAIQLGPSRFPLEYHFEPGSPRDGVTMNVPLALLNQVPAARCEWLVPGLLKEKVRLLAKSMPQRLRHKLGPLEQFAQAFCDEIPPSDTPLGAALSRYMRSQLNLEVPMDAFRPDAVPAHLRMNFRIVGDDERQLGMDRDLGELKRQFAQKTEDILKEESSSSESERHTGWTLGELPEILELEREGQTLIGYPALVDGGEAVTL